MARVLLVLLALAVALAGCANAPGGGTSTTPETITNEQAAALLRTSAQELPDRYGMEMTVTKAGREIMAWSGSFDNASGTAYLQVRGDASAFGQGAGAEDAADLLANGLSIYMTKDGALYLANGTAFVFPPTEDDGHGHGSGFVPSPDDSPFGSFLDPEEGLADLGENVTIHSVTPTTHKGKPAYEIVASGPADFAFAVGGDDGDHGEIDGPEGRMNATITVYSATSRLARIETVAPEDHEDPADPMAGATVVVDLLYDDEVDLDVPPAARRAMGLAYKSDRSPFDFSGYGEESQSSTTTWTFLAREGPATSSVEVHVKEAGSGAEMGDLASLPTKWTMKLSEGTKSQDGVTITFTDADGNGKVSANDTLRIELGGDELPQVVLFDTETGTYVVPGAPLLVLLAGLAVVALLRRRAA